MRPIRGFPFFLFLALIPMESFAATKNGADLGGGDLIPANGDVLSGTFTNVGSFVVGPGTTAFVAGGVNLAVYAATITIYGAIDASGRGQYGGQGGAANSPGLGGFAADPGGAGGGAGGAAAKGGGGGGAGNAAGNGAGNSGGTGAGGAAAGGAMYGSTGVVASPISPSNMFQGSGGGGGGGGGAGSSTKGQATGGAAGGGAVYLEASSMTVVAGSTITVAGSTAAAAADTAIGVHPAAGGGGGGGTILFRIPGSLTIAPGAQLYATGGGGGSVIIQNCSTLDPGGGGAGGRVKIFSRPASFAGVVVSTNGGPAGGNGITCGGSIDAPAPTAGGDGTFSTGIIASSPTALTAKSVYATSIFWTWNVSPDTGTALTGNPGYHLYFSSAAPPYPAPMVSTGPLASGTTELSLTPNTTFYRVATFFSDFGDSLPSGMASAHTLAAAPAAAAFTAMADTSLAVNWTAGSPSNPAYTQYEADRSLSADFSGQVAASTSGLSLVPTGLTPNTTYYFRVRAINIDGVPSDFASALATATLATLPAGPAAAAVYVTSAAFGWGPGQNPADTNYVAQLSTDNFFTIAAASITLTSGATFFNLTPGTQYFFRVEAVNRESVATAFTAAVSTIPGLLTNTSAPSTPAAPQPDRAISYDGTAVFGWPAASSPVGILDYFLQIGSTPGGGDFFSGSTTTVNFAVSGLTSGKTYYGQVRARSNAGVYGAFSSVGAGVVVYIPLQVPPAAKPYNWPNPFDPAKGSTSIGFFLEAPATVVLRIFTLQGELVHEATLSYGAAGNQVMAWNGANDRGATVSPGGYIVMIQKRYSDHTDTQKFKMAVLY